MKIRLLITYNGKPYQGWQKQPSTPTIQGELEKALAQVFKEPLSIIGAGRTDSGTHAFGQVAHFNKPKSVKSLNIQKALNAYLPKTIRIKQVYTAPVDFHAQKSCHSKSYIYCVLNSALPSVFRLGQVYWYPYKIHYPLLQKMSAFIKGKKDFKSFQNTGTPVAHTVRKVYKAYWLKPSESKLVFYIRGEGFLKQMIRNLVGTQLALLRYVDKGYAVHQILQKWEDIFLAKNRKASLTTAPACGLYLHKVFYPKDIDKKCQKI